MILKIILFGKTWRLFTRTNDHSFLMQINADAGIKKNYKKSTRTIFKTRYVLKVLGILFACFINIQFVLLAFLKAPEKLKIAQNKNVYLLNLKLI